MNWKIQFWELTGWRQKNEWRTVKNLHKIAYGNVSEALRKRLGLDFFHGNNFSHQFREIYQYQKGWTHLLCPPTPIYRRKEGGGCRPARPGELGCFHQKAPPSFGTFRKAEVGLVSICTPFSLNTPPFVFFYWFISETLRNFTDYVTTLIFFSECCETLRIT